jgi:hypothetical protein
MITIHRHNHIGEYYPDNDILKWCVANFEVVPYSSGQFLKHWRSDQSLPWNKDDEIRWQYDNHNFYFRYENDATLFKLTWL